MGDDPVADIEVEDDEHLPVGHSDIQPAEIGADVAGIFNRFGHYVLPNLFDLELDHFDFHEESFLVKETFEFQVHWLDRGD